MAATEQNNFAQTYLSSQVDDNYSRFIVTTLVLGFIGFVFTGRNLYYLSQDLTNGLQVHYLVIWVALLFFSAAFRYILLTAKKANDVKRLDLAMFFYALFICLTASTITALQSLAMPNFTAFSFAILGTVTAYRASTFKYVTIMILSTMQFSLIYFYFLNQPLSFLFLLPVVAICIVAYLIARSLESNRRQMLRLSLELKASNEQLKAETIQDPLTKVYNRRYLTDFLQRETKEFARSNEAFCIAVCDIDHFKKINDNLGHLTGDSALIAIAEVLKQSSRSTDILTRFGGEEFVIVMPRTSLSSAKIVVERMKDKINTHQFEHIPWSLSASFGLTEIRPKDTDILLLARADSLLYKAKDSGRNCIITDHIPTGPEDALASI